MRCAVAGCHTDYQSKDFTNALMFFRFPNDENLSKEWVNACKRADKVNVKNARICSKHFDKNCYERNLKFELLGYSARNRRLLKRDALPTLNLPLSKLHKKNAEESSSIKNRDDRLNKRRPTEFVEHILQTSTNTDIDARDDIIRKMKEENEALRNENNLFTKIFSPVQLNKLKHAKKRATWTVEDISKVNIKEEVVYNDLGIMDNNSEITQDDEIANFVAEPQTPTVNDLFTTSPKKNQGDTRTDDTRLEEADQIMNPSVKTSPLDTVSVYGLYVANKLRGYSKNTQIEVEHAINNILYNADKGLYDCSVSNLNSQFINSASTSNYPVVFSCAASPANSSSNLSVSSTACSTLTSTAHVIADNNT